MTIQEKQRPRMEFAEPPVFPSQGVADLVRELWKGRIWVVSGSLAFLLVGIAYALLARPSYQSQAILAPKVQSSSGSGTALLSQLGGMGSMLSSQLNLPGSSLERLQSLLKSRDIVETVIVRNDLIPRLFPVPEEKRPSLKEAVEIVRGGQLDVTMSQKLKVLTVTAVAGDSVLARDLIDYLLSAVEDWIKVQAIRDSDRNRRYLEEQLQGTVDPLVREKIQQLIGSEIEKSILMGSNSFDVLERARVPIYRLRPKRMQIAALSLILGCMFSGAAVLGINRLRGVQVRGSHQPR